MNYAVAASPHQVSLFRLDFSLVEQGKGEKKKYHAVYQTKTEQKRPPYVTVGIRSTNSVLQVDYCVFFCSPQTEQRALGGPVFVLSG